jgi:ATP-dependent RNA helicase SUPV3L1/SUV3
LVARFVEREGRRPTSTPAAPGRREKPAKPARRRPTIDREAVADGPFAKLLELELGPAPLGESARDDAWVTALVEAPHERFVLDDRGCIHDHEHQQLLARLVRGVDLLHPEVALEIGEELGAGARSRIQRRLVAWTRDLVAQLLAPLRTGAVDKLSSDGKGVVYQLEQGLGTIHRGSAEAQLRRLRGRDRQLLRSLGIEFGASLIWLPKLLRGDAPRVRALLCSAALPKGVRVDPPRPGAVALVPDPTIDPDAYTALGYPVFGSRAIRADIVERVHALLTELAPPFELPAELSARAGIRRDELPEFIEALGFVELDDGRWQARP